MLIHFSLWKDFYNDYDGFPFAKEAPYNDRVYNDGHL